MTARTVLLCLACVAPALAQEKGKEQDKPPLELGPAILAAEKERPAGEHFWTLEEEGKVRRVVRFDVKKEAEKGWTVVGLTDRTLGEERSTTRIMAIVDGKGRTNYVNQDGKADGTAVTRELNVGDESAAGLVFFHGKERREPEKFGSKADARGLPAALVPLVLAHLAAKLPAEGTVEVISEDCQRQRATPFTSKKEGAAVVIGLDGKEVARVEQGKLVRLHGLVAKEVSEAEARKLR